MLLSADFWIQEVFYELFVGLWGIAPILLVIFFAGALFTKWVDYRRRQVINGKQFILLEIKVPRDVLKSPLAMEVVLEALFQGGGETTWIDRLIFGKIRTWFSLEIVSVEGAVHFFIYCEGRFKDLVSSQIYSQYPAAEVHEVSDYALKVPYTIGDDWDIYGAEYTLTKPDPYPIKTYVDYELDRQYRVEEEKVDPLTSVLEQLGSVGRGEQIWLQILIRVNKGKQDPTFAPWQRSDWREEAERIVDELLQREHGTRKPKAEELQETEGMVFRTIPSLTQYERDMATTIQRLLAKNGFDVGIRAVYVARKESFSGNRISLVRGVMRPFSSQMMNGLKPTNSTDFDWPWQPYVGWERHQSVPTISLSGERLRFIKEKMFDAYRRRSYFLPPYQHKSFVLTTEELATLYHFPGGVAETPTFGRIESRKAEPPSNVPL